MPSDARAPVPALWMRDDRGRLVPQIDPRGGPVVLLLARGWALPGGAELDALRGELRGLGATLLALDGAVVVRLRPDDPPDELLPDAPSWRGLGDPFDLFGAGAEIERGAAVLLVLDPRGF